jgi:hypothetical protein
LGISFFSLLIYYEDIKNVLNDNYIVEKVSIYELKKTYRTKARGQLTPKYILTSYGKQQKDTLFFKLDIISYSTILEHKNQLRQEFIFENPDENIVDMSQYRFDTYIDSYRGYKFDKWQKMNEITVYYLPESKLIFRYKFNNQENKKEIYE